MGRANEPVWPDEDYRRYLHAERQLYAWCLSRVGGVPPDEALARAMKRFPYEPPDAPHHGLIHHAGAWRIAMVDLYGDHTRKPEEFGVAAELEAEMRRLFHGDELEEEPAGDSARAGRCRQESPGSGPEPGSGSWGS